MPPADARAFNELGDEQGADAPAQIVEDDLEGEGPPPGLRERDVVQYRLHIGARDGGEQAGDDGHGDTRDVTRVDVDAVEEVEQGQAGGDRRGAHQERLEAGTVVVQTLPEISPQDQPEKTSDS
eukprot:CAMPEP_0194318228 /NCGR_PEP_ID=MMETSP0171-20130528/14854_1 /TAXON_ID=218684 /ORGANISM="Corethron pennatum, Strain L29A3" /LENGTH=123 /DNA_ID=CAMNT_0039075069 /DNA_START=448 /DNA_END=820 /DNA_ORIENTATION=+